MKRLSRGLPRAVRIHRRSTWAKRQWLERAGPRGEAGAPVGKGLWPGWVPWHSFDVVSCYPTDKGPEDQTYLKATSDHFWKEDRNVWWEI